MLRARSEQSNLIDDINARNINNAAASRLPLYFKLINSFGRTVLKYRKSIAR